jgi:hypothetical protein
MGKSMSKMAVAKAAQGLFRIPENLTRKLKHGSKEEGEQKKELDAWIIDRDEKISQVVRWLQADGAVDFDYINAEQFNKLKKNLKAEAIKVSDVSGGIWTVTCTVKAKTAEQQLAGLVGDGPEQEKYNREVKAYEVKKTKWNKRWGKLVEARETYHSLLKVLTADLALKEVKAQFGYKKCEFMAQVPPKPAHPRAPEAKKARVVRTIRISLFRVTTKKIVVNKKVNKMGKSVTKKMYKEVTTTDLVHEMIAPLDNDIHAKEIPMVVAEVCARLPRGGVIPQWDQYEYKIVG